MPQDNQDEQFFDPRQIKPYVPTPEESPFGEPPKRKETKPIHPPHTSVAPVVGALHGKDTGEVFFKPSEIKKVAIKDPRDKTLMQRFTEPQIKPEDVPGVKAAKRLTEHEIAGGNPLRAALASQVETMAERTGTLVSSLDSWSNVALSAVGLGEEALAEKEMGLAGKVLYGALKTPTRAAMAWFGLQGAKMMSTPKGENESWSDYLSRWSFGASALTGTLAGFGATGSELVKNTVQRHFGLSDDLAAKVNTKLDKVNSVHQEAALRAGRVPERPIATDPDPAAGTPSKFAADLKTEAGPAPLTPAQQIERETQAAIDAGKAKLTQLQQDRLKIGSQVVADSMQALLDEHQRVSEPFDKMAETIQGGVSSPEEIHGIVESAVGEYGVKPEEVPPNAFRALGKEMDPEEAALTAKGQKAPTVNPEQSVKQAGAVYVGIQKMYGVRADQVLFQPTEGGTTLAVDIDKATPENIARKMRGEAPLSVERRGFIGEPPTRGGDITFDRLTAVREDLWQAGQASKDSRIKAGLAKAQEAVTDLQEKIAGDHGLGSEYKAAKNGYLKFKRGIGSRMVDQWLDAYDAEAQNMIPKLAELTSRENATALRTVLKAAGVDVKPLDGILDQMAQTREAMKGARAKARAAVAERAASEAQTEEMAQSFVEQAETERKAEEARVRAAEEWGNKTIAAYKKEADDIGLGDVENLKGKMNEQLLRMRLRQQLRNMKGAGSFALTSMIYGAARLLTGNVWGLGIAGGALARVEGPLLLRNPEVQNWILRQGGIIKEFDDYRTPEANRYARGLSELSRRYLNLVRKGGRTTVPGNTAQGNP